MRARKTERQTGECAARNEKGTLQVGKRCGRLIQEAPLVRRSFASKEDFEGFGAHSVGRLGALVAAIKPVKSFGGWEQFV